MEIRPGDKLKTLFDFEREILNEISKIDPSVSHNFPPLPGSKLDSILKIMAQNMWEQQEAYHRFMMTHMRPPSTHRSSFMDAIMGPPSSIDDRYVPPTKVECCQPKDLKLYDSGFSKFQYCGVCNKEHK